jgi:hypothetical protein
MDGLALLALGAVLCASALAQRLLERPAQSFLGGLLRRPVTAPSESSAVDMVVKDGAAESSV